MITSIGRKLEPEEKYEFLIMVNLLILFFGINSHLIIPKIFNFSNMTIFPSSSSIFLSLFLFFKYDFIFLIPWQ